MGAFDIDTDALFEQIERARNGGVLPNTVIEVDWSHLPEETVDNSPIALVMSGLERQLSLRATVATIDRAAKDDRVTGLVARVQPLVGALSVVQELRAAIHRFRAAGKPTIAFAENLMSNAGYHLASAFDKVVVLEAGGVWVTGVRAETSFLGDALPKLGIEPQYLHRHEYKNMANIFTETDYTEPHREAVTALLEGTLEQRVADVAADRGLTEAEVRQAFADGPFGAPEAVDRNLIDAVGFRDEVWAEATADGGKLLYLSRYAHHSKPKKKATSGAPTIAVIPVVGTIADGKSGMKPGLPPGKGAGSDSIVDGIRNAVENDDVKAIVLRVDSPGGSAIASEMINRAIVVAKKAGKPIVSSMGTVAASGGYYVSAPCDRIVASPGTITGSIGVVMGKFATRPLREKLAVSTKALETDENAGILSMLDPWNDDHLAALDADLDRMYELFLRRVADGRGMERDAVHEVAKGRVWIGATAKEKGLVDVLGGFRDAVGEAKSLAGIDPDAIVKVVEYPKSSPLDLLQKRENSDPAGRMAAWVGSFLWQAAQDWERTMASQGARAELPGNWIVD